MRSIGLVFAGIAVGCSANLAVWAQTGGPCIPGVNAVSYGVTSQKNAPFTGTETTTFEQKLFDGNVIRGTTVTHEARDSAGRTRIEMHSGCEPGTDGIMQDRTMVTVYDPATGDQLRWTESALPEKVATIYHRAPRPARTPEELMADQERVKAYRASSSMMPRIESHVEKLGTRTFNGIEAEGVRNTQTTPVGKEGNEMPLVTTYETWTVKDKAIVVSHMQDNPRYGKTTMTVDVSLGEPSAALFEPPAGYKVIEQPVVQHVP